MRVLARALTFRVPKPPTDKKMPTMIKNSPPTGLQKSPKIDTLGDLGPLWDPAEVAVAKNSPTSPKSDTKTKQIRYKI